MLARRAALDTLCCVRSSRWSGGRVGDGVRRPARVRGRDLVARQRGCVARPRVTHNCFAKGVVSGLRNHVAHRSGMIVSFGVAEDAAAQRKVDFRFGSKADMCSAKRHVRFTPESGHVRRNFVCPLCANSGHRVYSITSSALLGKRSSARQNNLYFGELTRLCLDLY